MNEGIHFNSFNQESNAVSVRTENGELYPASLAQRRLWLLDQLERGPGAYNLHVGLRLRGRLEISTLKACLADIANRHETLRTHFQLENEELWQVVNREAVVPLEITDLSEVRDEELRLEQAYGLALEELRRRFSLSVSPLFRCHVLRLDAEHHVFLCVMHHCISDGRSMEIFVHELTSLYEAYSKNQPSPLPLPSIQYGDYALWERELADTDLFRNQLTFWKRQLVGAPGLLDLPSDKVRPAEQTFTGASLACELSPELITAIRELARAQEVTPFMVVLAVFKVLLCRYADQQDLVLGIPVAGRGPTEIESTIGCFVNTLVLRTDLSGNPTFKDVLSRVRETMMDALDHAEVPFEKIVQELQPDRSLSYNPVFQVMCSAVNAPVRSNTFGDLTAHPYVVGSQTSIFDLVLTLIEAPDLKWSISVQYNDVLFREQRIRRLLGHFRTILESVAHAPQTSIADIPVLTETERQQLDAWSDTSRAYPDVCIHGLVEQQARRTPDAEAVSFEGRTLSYAELEEQASSFAARLVQHGVRPGELVALCLERSLQLLPAILGILKAGAAYVPIDPSFPQQRISFMLLNSKATLVVAEPNVLHRLQDVPCPVLLSDAVEDISHDRSVFKAPGQNPESPAYVLYTSGSTGRPKGVCVPHRAVVNLLCSMARQPGISCKDRLLAITTLSFDIAGLELFLPLTCGACVVLASRETALEGTRLMDALNSEQITMMQATPATWRMLIDAGWYPADRQFKALCGGEALSQDLANELLERTDLAWNLYGPTETTIWSACSRIDAESPVSLGYPIDNTEFYVLDRSRKLVPVGIPGELYIGGSGLALGYLHNPELTNERFVPHPFRPDAKVYRTGDQVRYRDSGELEYLGRLDFQVKVRGFRIELGEIESALRKYPGVRSAVVDAREIRSGDLRLVAYLIAEREISSQELRAALRDYLPEYMIPNIFMFLEAFPLTLNGKIDRKALPQPGLAEQRSNNEVAVGNDEERLMARIWEDVLGIQNIGLNDNFFDLGGHSLLAARLIIQIQKRTGRQLPLSALFRAPTIASLALLLKEDDLTDTDPLLLEIHPGKRDIVFFSIASPGVNTTGFALLSRHVGEDQSVFKVQADGPTITAQTSGAELQKVASRYVAGIRSVQPQGPYYLGAMCDGVLIATEMIRQLEEQGQVVGLLVIFDTWVLENSQIRWLWTINYYRQRLRTVRGLNTREQLAMARRALRSRFGRRTRKAQSANEPGVKSWAEVYWPGPEFKPPQFEAPVLIFKRPMQPFFYIKDEQMGWGARSKGGVETIAVDCRHSEILREPYVRQIGKAIAGKLAAARSALQAKFAPRQEFNKAA